MNEPFASLCGSADASMRTSKERLLKELELIAEGDSVIDALAVAIAVEDIFGIVLSDADLAPEHLCSPDALAATVNRCLGGA